MADKVVWKKITVKEATWRSLMEIKLRKNYKSIDQTVQKECGLPCRK